MASTSQQIDRYSAFRYLNADKAGLYRKIMTAFVSARDRFQLHMRPDEVASALARDCASDEQIDHALQQLRDWGNLDRHVDTAEVQTVEQFYRPRFLFSMTPAGVAVEEAVVSFEHRLAQRGKLDTAALRDVRERVIELAELLEAEPVDLGKAGRSLRDLAKEFELLAAESQSFLQSLHRSVELQTMELEHFIAYKQKLVDYLERFIHELLLVTSEVSEVLDQIDEHRVQPVLISLAEADCDAEIEADETFQEAAILRWENRWRGVRAWFLSKDGQRAQAVVMRERARAAIPALLEAVSGINERRVNRSDRAADFKTLAQWFFECPSEQDAHRLWLAAFGLSSCRHLRVDGPTLDEREQSPVSTKTRWLDAPPLQLSPRLRKTGRHTKPGRSTKMIDRRAEQQRLHLAAQAEHQQIEQARDALVSDRPTRLSEFDALDPVAFRLLLDLLGHALARQDKNRKVVETTSSDGGLTIQLEPLGEDTTATLRTSGGTLTGRDHVVLIRQSHQMRADHGG